MRKIFLLSALLLFSAACAFAIERAVTIVPAPMYISPDTTASKLANLDRGTEMVVIEHGGHNWIHIEATISRRGWVAGEDSDEEGQGDRTVSGWIQDKGVVRADTPNGDRVLFGEAADSEAEASRRHGRRNAEKDAQRLYYFVAEYFPQSSVAGEALYRSADIKWQIERADVMARPSGHEMESYLREGMDDHLMKQVIKKYPSTKWADLAAFSLLDNKVCGDWKGESKCPEKEADMYEKYVADHPQSPRAPEALYNAAWRQSALIDIYRTEKKDNKSADAKGRATGLAQKLVSQYPNSVDWATRGQRLLFMMAQNIPTYGTVTTSSDNDGPNSQP